MKITRPLMVITISLLVGAAAVLVAAKWVSTQASVATSKVVVASRDLEVGTRLRPDMVQTVEWPTSAALKDPLTDVAKVQDRVINTQILRGEPIIATKLAPPGEKGGLSAVLSEGRRAITVKVNEIVGVAGFALPGNYVDVMVNTPDESNRPVSKIVLERILVLAVAQETSTSEAKPRLVNAVTLDVSPAEAEGIDLARSIGSLSLVLRSQSDKTSSITAGVRKNDLLRISGSPADLRPKDGPKATAVAVAPAKPKAVQTKSAAAKAPEPEKFEVIRGLKKSFD
jgi:pilus assembly protein CpaB